MPFITLLYFLKAQHVSGTTMPIIRSSRLITTLVVSFCTGGGLALI